MHTFIFHRSYDMIHMGTYWNFSDGIGFYYWEGHLVDLRFIFFFNAYCFNWPPTPKLDLMTESLSHSLFVWSEMYCSLGWKEYDAVDADAWGCERGWGSRADVSSVVPVQSWGQIYGLAVNQCGRHFGIAEAPRDWADAESYVAHLAHLYLWPHC